MKTPTDKLLPTLATWDLGDLQELKAALTGLIEALEPSPEESSEVDLTPTDRTPVEAEMAATGTQERKTARGHLEVKYIPRGRKRHGPYLYLRYWQDGKLRSKYLGKAER